MAFCLHCGQRVPDESANCAGCGAPIGRGKAIAPTESIEQLARDGRKIEAIKAYRQSTGAGLKEARDAVENWMQDGIWPSRPTRSASTGTYQQLARDGRKIEAIKAYREETGASLKEAKDAVEEWMRSEGIIGQRGAGCATSVLVAGLLAAGGLSSLW